jgi:hypothetical protein
MNVSHSKMEKTYSREFLQAERSRFREEIRQKAIQQYVRQTEMAVIGAAREGKTQYTVDTTAGNLLYGNYTLTTDDLVEGFSAKFPGCKVEYGETWETSTRNPNQMNKKTGIVIDWS